MNSKSYSDNLYHHGIKGQKWGIKNGPPYPIEVKTIKKKIENLEKSMKNSRAANTALEIAQIGYDIITFDLLGIAMDTVSLVNSGYQYYKSSKMNKILEKVDMDIPVSEINRSDRRTK